MHLSDRHKDPEDPPCHNITDGKRWDKEPADGKQTYGSGFQFERTQGQISGLCRQGLRGTRGGRRGVTGWT